jgi:hypothetical protein
MSWSLSASGHTPDEETERNLAAVLGKLLADSAYGTSTVSFGGSWVHGDVRPKPEGV